MKQINKPKTPQTFHATLLLLQVLQSSLIEVAFTFMSNSAKQSCCLSYVIDITETFAGRAVLALKGICSPQWELFPSTLFILLSIFVKVFPWISGTQHNSGSLLLANERNNRDATVPEPSEATQDSWYLK